MQSLLARGMSRAAAVDWAAPRAAAAMDGLVRRVLENNRGAPLRRSHVPFVLDGPTPLGYVDPIDCKILVESGEAFEMTECAVEGRAGAHPCLTLAGPLRAPGVGAVARTAAVGGVMAALRARGGVLQRWYDELFPVTSTFGAEPAFLLERGAYTMLGVRGYGVHVSGYVEEPGPDKPLRVWVAQRSATKPTYPNMLDCLVGGGQPHGLSLVENIIKECVEEASIPEHLARSARPAGVISYTSVERAPNGAQRLQRDTLFSFDLKLPVEFTPYPSDGEVQNFQLHEVSWVIAKLVEGGPLGFKANINITMIDFLIRHGYIAADSPNFLELVDAVHGAK